MREKQHLQTAKNNILRTTAKKFCSFKNAEMCLNRIKYIQYVIVPDCTQMGLFGTLI